MASSPSSCPFFSPTTAPSYAPTAFFSPTPCGCGAPPYAPYSFSPAAIYAPPLSHGGHSTSPFPFVCSAPPASPCAGAYPYQPPASMYTPAYGFSPFQQPPTPTSTPIPTNVQPNWPPPAPDPTSPIPTSTPSSYWSSSTTTPVPPPHPATARQMLSSAAPSSSSLAYYPRPPTTGAPAISARPAKPKPDKGDDGPIIRSATTADAEHAEERARQRAQRDARSVARRLEGHQAKFIASCNTLHGQMAQMTVMMASMQSSLARIAPPEGTQTADFQTPNQGCEFITPPRTSTTLFSTATSSPTSSHISTSTIEPPTHFTPTSTPYTDLSSPEIFTRRTSITLPPSTKSKPSCLLELPDAYSTVSTEMEPVHTSASGMQPDVKLFLKLPDRDASTVTPATNSSSLQVHHTSSTAPSTMPSTTACVAPQVFGEMPTPNSGHGTHVIAPGYDNCCYGYPHQIHSSCVQGGSRNLCEQYVDEVQQSYDFNNLIGRSVSLADGTKRRYYALPADYPLERDTTEPVFAVYDEESDGCSNDHVHVLTGTPEQLTYEEEQPENSQALKCFGKPIFSSEKHTIGHAGVFSLTTEQKPDIKLCGKHVKPQQVNNQQWNMQITEAGRKEWDPGTVQIMVEVPVVVKWSSLEVSVPLSVQWDPGALAPLHSSKAEPARELGYVAMLVPEVMSLCIQDGSYVQKLRDSSCSVLVTHQRRKEWHPGADTIPSSTSTRDNRFYSGVPSRLINHGIQFFWDPGILNQMHIMPLVLSASYKEVTGGCLADQELMSNTSCKVATFTWHSSITACQSCLHPKVDINEIDTEEVKVKVNGGNSITSPGRSTGGIISFTNEMKPDAGLLVVCFNNTSDNAFSEEAADFTFSHGPGILYELWWLTKGTGYVLRHLLAVKFGTHNYTSFIDTAASMCWRPANSVQQIRNIAALLPFHQCILLSSAVCLWDPGIAISSYMYSWLEMTAVKTSTWLQSPLPMNKTSSVWDPAIESLYFSCNRLNITELIQIKGWISMAYSGISLSQSPYIFIFLHGQLEFVCHQGVHETDSAKHSLLSSPIYLQNREMDIFFITFLPP